MKNKKLAIIIAAVLIVAVGAGAGFALGTKEKNKDNTTLTETTASQQAVSESTSANAAEETSSDLSESESVSETETTGADISFAKKGYWYLFDEENMCAYAFCFSDAETAEFAYFDTANVNGEDAQYLSSDVSYRVEGNTIIIDNLPKTVKADKFELTVDGKKLIYGKTELVQNEKLSLDIPFEYFNA